MTIVSTIVWAFEWKSKVRQDKILWQLVYPANLLSISVSHSWSSKMPYFLISQTRIFWVNQSNLLSVWICHKFHRDKMSHRQTIEMFRWINFSFHFIFSSRIKLKKYFKEKVFLESRLLLIGRLIFLQQRVGVASLKKCLFFFKENF